MEPRIAIIGAGISGLAAAKALRSAGLKPILFDKARGPAGRTATRRGEEGMDWDHGAQYFTARSWIFQQALNEWLDMGIAAKWQPRFATIKNESIDYSEDLSDRYVGVPKMNAIAKHLATDFEIRCSSTVTEISRNDELKWQIACGSEIAPETFDELIVTIPPKQALNLFSSLPDHIESQLASITFHPTWSLLLKSEKCSALTFDVVKLEHPVLNWMARNNSKPGRIDDGKHDHWTIHASHAWSKENLELDKEEAAKQLLSAICKLEAFQAFEPIHATAHRWRYANPDQVLNKLYLNEDTLSFCGDWCIAGRVEDAFLSGFSLGQKLASRYATTENHELANG